MSPRRAKRLLLGLFVGVLVFAVWELPGPIDGYYRISDVETAGRYFLVLAEGRAYWIAEYEEKPIWLGTYAMKRGVGWVWSRPGARGPILMQPALLYLRFTSLVDGSTAIEWRYPYIFAARRMARDKVESAGSPGQRGGALK